MKTYDNPRAYKIYGGELDFGTALRVARALSGMSVKELSEKSGATRGTISTIERLGKNANPNYKTIKAVAEAMNISTGAMLELSDRVKDMLIEVKK